MLGLSALNQVRRIPEDGVFVQEPWVDEGVLWLQRSHGVMEWGAGGSEEPWGGEGGCWGFRGATGW